MLENMCIGPPEFDKHSSHRFQEEDSEEEAATRHEEGEVVDKAV